MSSFTSLFNQSNTIDLTGRTQVKKEELLEKKLTIIDYSCYNGKSGRTAIVIFKELPDKFYFASKILTELLDSVTENNKKDELVKDGMNIILHETPNKDNSRRYISVTEW